ncbi:MAG: hypothetical protein HQ559_10060 [Lentisphaerae bacterium]|nr:hypothetical protein [Lentisphaerota bacterium]
MKTSRPWFLSASCAVLVLGLAELRLAITTVEPPDLGYSGADMGPAGLEYLDVTMHGPLVESAAPNGAEEDLPVGLQEILRSQKKQGIDVKASARKWSRVGPPPEEVAGLLPTVPASPERDASDWGTARSWGWLADGVLEAKRAVADELAVFDEAVIPVSPPREVMMELALPQESLALFREASLPSVSAPVQPVSGEDSFSSLRDLLGSGPGEGSGDALGQTLTPWPGLDRTYERPGSGLSRPDVDSLLPDTERGTLGDTLDLSDGESSLGEEEPGRPRQRFRDEDGLGILGR